MDRRVLTVKQIREIDRVAIQQKGIPSIALMENAGRSVAFEVLRQLKRRRHPRVCVFCGMGNNAGDGFVVARHLLNAGVRTDIFLVGRARDLKNDAAVNYRILRNYRYPVREIQGVDRVVRRSMAEADLLIDAIFGVGLNREISEPFKGIITALNHSRKRIVAVDIPSGLDGTTGKIYGVCVRAKETVTFICAKKGFFKKQGPAHVGRILVADIGIPSGRLSRRG